MSFQLDIFYDNHPVFLPSVSIRNRRSFSVKESKQRQLALQSGINTSYLGQIERGEKNPTIKTLEKIAAALDISLLDLITDIDIQKREKRLSQKFLALFSLEDIKRYLIDILQNDDKHDDS